MTKSSETRGATEAADSTSQQLPGPDPALKRLEKFVGTWDDPTTGKFPSTVYSNLVGIPIAYEYDVQDNHFSIRTELAGGATFKGAFSKDGNSGSGGWRPDKGMEGPGNVAYDITTTRVR